MYFKSNDVDHDSALDRQLTELAREIAPDMYDHMIKHGYGMGEMRHPILQAARDEKDDESEIKELARRISTGVTEIAEFKSKYPNL